MLPVMYSLDVELARMTGCIISSILSSVNIIVAVDPMVWEFLVIK
jgi:hypothetical protein